jgi:hypothetical protein
MALKSVSYGLKSHRIRYGLQELHLWRLGLDLMLPLGLDRVLPLCLCSSHLLMAIKCHWAGGTGHRKGRSPGGKLSPFLPWFLLT